MKPYLHSILESVKRHRICIILLSAFFILLVGLTMLLCEKCFNNLIEQQAEILLEETADIGISVLNHEINSNIGALSLIAKNPVLLEKRDVNAYLEELKSFDPIKKRKYKGIISKTGELYTTAGEKSNAAGHGFFRRIMEGEDKVVDTVNEITGDEAVVLAVPVEKDGETFFVLWALLEANELEEALAASLSQGIKPFILTDKSKPASENIQKSDNGGKIIFLWRYIGRPVLATGFWEQFLRIPMPTAESIK